MPPNDVARHQFKDDLALTVGRQHRPAQSAGLNVKNIIPNTVLLTNACAFVKLAALARRTNSPWSAWLNLENTGAAAKHSRSSFLFILSTS
jgi:hypothetical protein